MREWLTKVLKEAGVCLIFTIVAVLLAYIGYMLLFGSLGEELKILVLELFNHQNAHVKKQGVFLIGSTPCFCIYLPDAQDSLHQKTDAGDGNPAAKSCEYGFAAALDQMYNVCVPPDGGHGHNDQKLTQFLERIGNSGRQLKHRSDYGGKHKKEHEERKNFF